MKTINIPDLRTKLIQEIAAERQAGAGWDAALLVVEDEYLGRNEDVQTRGLNATDEDIEELGYTDLCLMILDEINGA